MEKEGGMVEKHQELDNARLQAVDAGIYTPVNPFKKRDSSMRLRWSVPRDYMQADRG